MPMSNAERQRRFHERHDANVERRLQYLQESKEKYERDKAEGKRKSIKDMTEREKRHVRRVWRLQKKKQQKFRRANLEAQQNLTPPETPEVPRYSIESRQQKQEMKGRARLRAKCYRDLNQKLTKLNC